MIAVTASISEKAAKIQYVKVVSVACTGHGFSSPDNVPVTIIDNRENVLSPCEAYQQALDKSAGMDAEGCGRI